MAERLRKPQYRTLINALEVLLSAQRGIYGPAEEGVNLGQRIARLERAMHQAEDVIGRARAAMAEKARKGVEP